MLWWREYHRNDTERISRHPALRHREGGWHSLVVNSSTAALCVLTDYSAVLESACVQCVCAAVLRVRYCSGPKCSKARSLVLQFATETARMTWQQLLRDGVTAYRQFEWHSKHSPGDDGDDEFAHLTHLHRAMSGERSKTPSGSKTPGGRLRRRSGQVRRSSFRSRSGRASGSGSGGSGGGGGGGGRSPPTPSRSRSRRRRGTSTTPIGTVSTPQRAVSDTTGMSARMTTPMCRLERIQTLLVIARWLEPPRGAVTTSNRAVMSWQLQHVILTACGVRTARHGGLRWAPALRQGRIGAGGIQSSTGDTHVDSSPAHAGPTANNSSSAAMPLLADLLKWDDRAVYGWNDNDERVAVGNDTALKLAFHESNSALQLCWVRFVRRNRSGRGHSDWGSGVAESPSFVPVEVREFASRHRDRWQDCGLRIMPLCSSLSLLGTVQLNSLADVVAQFQDATEETSFAARENGSGDDDANSDGHLRDIPLFLQDIRLYIDCNTAVCLPRSVYVMLTQLSSRGNVFSEDFLLLSRPPARPSPEHGTMGINVALAKAVVLLAPDASFQPLVCPADLDGTFLAPAAAGVRGRRGRGAPLASRYFRRIRSQKLPRAARVTPTLRSPALAWGMLKAVQRFRRIRHMLPHGGGESAAPSADASSSTSARGMDWPKKKKKKSVIRAHAARPDGRATANTHHVPLAFQLDVRRLRFGLRMTSRSRMAVNSSISYLEMHRLMESGTTCYVNAVVHRSSTASLALAEKRCVLLSAVVVGYTSYAVGCVDIATSARLIPDGYVQSPCFGVFAGDVVCACRLTFTTAQRCLTALVAYVYCGRYELVGSVPFVASRFPAELAGIRQKFPAEQERAWQLIEAVRLDRVHSRPATLQTMHFLQPMNTSYDAAVRAETAEQAKRAQRQEREREQSEAANQPATVGRTHSDPLRTHSRRPKKAPTHATELHAGEQAWVQRQHRARRARPAAEPSSNDHAMLLFT